MIVRYRREVDITISGVALLIGCWLILNEPRTGAFEQPCSGRGTLYCEVGYALRPLSVFDINPLVLAIVALLMFAAFYAARRAIHPVAIDADDVRVVLRRPLKQATVNWSEVSGAHHTVLRAGLYSHLSVSLSDGSAFSLPNVRVAEAQLFVSEVGRRSKG